MSNRTPRVVCVTRPTEYQLLIERHGTRSQARFFLETRGQDLADAEDRHRAFEAALRSVLAAIPTDWRRTHVTRGDLDRFLFGPGDVVVALGQDGLVANLAKYLHGQPVVGLNPDPDRNPGVLVPHRPSAASELLRAAASGEGEARALTMVKARLDDGQTLLALNELFIGHRSHQSARYRLGWEGREERQSSSGLIVATGTGATGWARSIHSTTDCPFDLPSPTDRRALFLVREPWPGPATGTSLTAGQLGDEATLTIVSEMDGEDGVVFGDGIEADHLTFPWGARLEVGVARRALRLVHAAQPARVAL